MKYFTILIILFFATGPVLSQSDSGLALQEAAAEEASSPLAEDAPDHAAPATVLYQQLARQVRAHIVKQIQYPQTRTATGIEGMVVVEVRIFPNGKIQQGTIVRSLHPEFDAAVMQALSSLRRVSVTQEIGPDGFRVLVPVKFRL